MRWELALFIFSACVVWIEEIFKKSTLAGVIMNKKGAALGIVAVLLALILLAIFLVGLALRECNSNKDCSDNAYCGSDYECHEYPNNTVVQKNNFVPAALILGVSLVLAMYLYRGGKIPFVMR